MNRPLRPLSFGEILDGAFVLYRRHFVTLAATALAAAIPLAALTAFPLAVLTRGTVLGVGSEHLSGAWTLILLAVSPAWALAAWCALQQQASAALMAQPVDPVASWLGALRRAPALWVQGVATWLVWLFFTLISLLGVGSVGLNIFALGVVGVVLGLLLWVGGVGGGQLVFFSLIFAGPAAVVFERRGPLGALNRSMELARDVLPRTMGLIGVCAVITLLPPLGVAGLAGLLPSAAGDGGDTLRLMLQQAAAMVVGSLTLPYFAICMTLHYYDRRVRTEAFDVQMLAEELPAI